LINCKVDEFVKSCFSIKATVISRQEKSGGFISVCGA
jgi:hypothetical protein